MKLVRLVVLLLAAVQLSSAQEAFNKARAALMSKDTASAVTGFQEALRLGQKNGDANYYLGAIAYNQGRVDDAVNFLSTAVRINDENVDALIALGDAYLQKRDHQSAIAQYKRALKVAPKDCRVPLAYGIALVDANIIDGADGAIVQLIKARECTPENPEVYIALGDAYKRQGVPFLANENYEKALDLSPKDLQTQLKVARTYASNRQYSEAVKAFQRAVTIDSTNFDGYFEAGKILYRAKLYSQAVPFMYRAVNLEPAHREAASIFAQSLVGASIWGEAMKAAEQAVKLDSNSVENWKAYAYALTENREYKDAINAFAALERRKALAPEDYSTYGRALYSAGEKQRSLEVLERAVREDSTNCDPYFNLGSLYMEQKDYVTAARMFEKKIACDPASLAAYLNAGLCYMQPPKELPLARERFLKAIELNPSYLGSRLWLARYYAEVDSSELMKETYDEVIRLASADAVKNKSTLSEAYSQRGSYEFSRKNYAGALDYFRRALNYNDSSPLNLVVGQCLILTRGEDVDENRRRTDEAIAKFRRSIQQDPSNAQAHFWLANSLTYMRKEGDTEGNRKLVQEACSEYAKTLRLDPRNDDAKKAMERIGCK